MTEIRWGLLSTANINRRVIPAIRNSKRGTLHAVASRSQPRAEQYAAEWEIPHAFGSYAAMLESDLIDAVYISLPNHLHVEWSIRALQAGKHVLCEKPLALSVAEVDAMIAASRVTGRYLAEAFMYLHHPQTRLVHEIVRRGDLGELGLVRGVFNFAFSSRENIRLEPEYGGGSLWDVGVYPLSYAQYLYGAAPEWVFGDQWRGDSGVDETFIGQLHYPGGGLAQISSAFRLPFYTFVEVLGTQGRLTMNRPFVGLDDNPELWFTPATGEPRQIPVPEEYLYQGEVEDLHDAVLDGKEPRLSLLESRKHIQTVSALYRSASDQQAVHLE